MNATIVFMSQIRTTALPGVKSQLVSAFVLARWFAFALVTLRELDCNLRSIPCPCEGKAIKRVHGENCAELFGFREADSFQTVTHEAARTLGVPNPLP
jgi:hypothetical protein